MKKKTIFLVTVSTVCMLSACGNNAQTNANTVTTAQETTAEETTQEQAIETEPQLLYFPSDETVNLFFEKYNSISNNPISAESIQEGNISTKALVYSDNFSLEVINSRNGFLSVSVETEPDKEDFELQQVFFDCIKGMLDDLSDQEINIAWNDIHSADYRIEDYELKGIKISYSPSVQLSYGYTAPKIEIIFPFN